MNKNEQLWWEMIGKVNEPPLNGMVLVNQFAERLRYASTLLAKEQDIERKACLALQAKLNLLGLVTLVGSTDGSSQVAFIDFMDAYLKTWLTPAMKNFPELVNDKDKEYVRKLANEILSSYTAQQSISLSNTQPNTDVGS